MVINRAYKFRIYPNLKQQRQLRKEFAASKVVYNYYLGKSIEHYKETGKGLSYYDWCRDLTSLKKQDEYCWLQEVTAKNLNQSLRDLDSAYAGFFRRLKKGERKKGFPKFKKANWSVRYPNQACKYFSDTHKIQLSKTGQVKIVDYTIASGKLMNITVSYSKDNKWYASLCIEQEVKDYVNTSTNEIGLDMGIKDYLIDSNGNKIDNPKFYISTQRKRRRLQRALSRKKIGSNNRKKAKLALAKFEAKIAAQRTNFLHQETTKLVKNNCLIAHEDLNVKGMLKNRHLAKYISDASWSTFFNMLAYKGHWYDCKIVVIGRFYPSSKLCGICGYKNTGLTLRDREWVCSECGSSLDRDVNAARNILAEGLKLCEP